ncbi:hypothetical protein J6590_025924 [Homalodisca vitripennis]|nr:hypothetical protein J6590_025924 [Homalodisca vitripennis]
MASWASRGCVTLANWPGGWDAAGLLRAAGRVIKCGVPPVKRTQAVCDECCKHRFPRGFSTRYSINSDVISHTPGYHGISNQSSARDVYGRN